MNNKWGNNTVNGFRINFYIWEISTLSPPGNDVWEMYIILVYIKSSSMHVVVVAPKPRK